MDKLLNSAKTIFKKHSVTYYYSTALFPKEIRHQVWMLYGFVRLADEVVDNPVEDPTNALRRFSTIFQEMWSKDSCAFSDGDDQEMMIIKGFILLAREKGIERSWVDAFLKSMEWDLHKAVYETMEELEEYVYGSAEVIGLMMAKIMGVKEEGLVFAQALGRSMQMINFVRDIHEDRGRGRRYIPTTFLQRANITQSEWDEYGGGHDPRFEKVVDWMMLYINRVQKEAEKGFVYLPRPCLLPVALAAKNYWSILKTIQKNPDIPFQKTLRSNKLLMLRDFIHLLFTSS